MAARSPFFYSASMVRRAPDQPPRHPQEHSISTLVKSSVLVLVLGLVAGSANAQAVRSEKNMSLELANQLADTAITTCAANGYSVAATVVDRAGTVRAVQRADNAGPHTLE